MDLGFKAACDLEPLALLGEGGFGAIYKVKSTKDNNQYALKIYKSKSIKIDDAIEIVLSRYLDHPNVIRCLRVIHQDECYETDKVACVLPLASHDSFLYIKDKSLALDIVPLMQQMLDAVMYLHQSHVIHADIKPENILVMPDGKFVLADLGLALLCPQTPQWYKYRGTGIYAYMPSVRRVKVPKAVYYLYSEWTDTYALGLTFYDLITRSNRQSNDLQDLNLVTNPHFRTLIYHMTTLDQPHQWTLFECTKYLDTISAFSLASWNVISPHISSVPGSLTSSPSLLMHFGSLCTTHDTSLAVTAHVWDLYFLAMKDIINDDAVNNLITLTGNIVVPVASIAESLFVMAVRFASDETVLDFDTFKNADLSYVIQLMKSYNSSLYRTTLAEQSGDLNDYIVLQYEMWGLLDLKDPNIISWYENNRLSETLKNDVAYTSHLLRKNINPCTYRYKSFTADVITFHKSLNPPA